MFTSSNAPAMRTVYLEHLTSKLEGYISALRASCAPRVVALRALQRQLGTADVEGIALASCSYRELRRMTEIELAHVLEIGEISARRYTEATTPSNSEKVSAHHAVVRFDLASWTVNDAPARAQGVLAVLDPDASRFVVVALADAISARLAGLGVTDAGARGVVAELRRRANVAEFAQLAGLVADAGDLGREVSKQLADELQITNAADSALRRRSPDADPRDMIRVEAFWEG